MRRERNPDSIRSQIGNLLPGECYSRAVRICLQGITPDMLNTVIHDLANSLGSAVKRVTTETGSTFSIETGHWFARNRDVVVSAIVTRTS